EINNNADLDKIKIYKNFLLILSSIKYQLRLYAESFPPNCAFGLRNLLSSDLFTLLSRFEEISAVKSEEQSRNVSETTEKWHHFFYVYKSNEYWDLCDQCEKLTAEILKLLIQQPILLKSVEIMNLVGLESNFDFLVSLFDFSKISIYHFYIYRKKTQEQEQAQEQPQQKNTLNLQTIEKYIQALHANLKNEASITYDDFLFVLGQFEINLSKDNSDKNFLLNQIDHLLNFCLYKKIISN
ncbi:hypothetical protein EDEG_01215, partial [Edhazardia aedis USNM 41457]